MNKHSHKIIQTQYMLLRQKSDTSQESKLLRKQKKMEKSKSKQYT